MAIPITVRCECGEVSKANLGDTVTCTCGRIYETSKLPSAKFDQVRAHQAKGRLYVRLGFVFVVGITVAAAFLWGMWGAAVAAPVSAMLWFRVIRRRFMRAFVPSPGELETLELEASNK